jgi:3,4-dihydroxy 2-butanone 4-phosphate synthase / GTP cyclohydrolase II
MKEEVVVTDASRQARAMGPAARVEAAVSALAQGRMVVVDDEDRENEGDLVVAADLLTHEQMAFLVAHTTGIVCVPLGEDRAEELELPPMVAGNKDAQGTAFTVSVDHVATGTGVSAVDRTRTVRALADPSTNAADLRRPGHVFPLRARAGGVLVRQGHTEAAVDLLRLAGRPEVGVISEIIDDDGSMRRGESLRRFAVEHGFPLVTIADLVRHRKSTERTVERMSESALPTRAGSFRAVAYRGTIDGLEHLALVMGDVAPASGPIA